MSFHRRMELIRLSIPYSFLRERARLSWREILFGLENQLLDAGSPALLARERVDEQTTDQTLIRLAGLDPEDDGLPYVRALAALEPEQSLDSTRSRWLCVVLAWIYEHRRAYDDPLRTVEEVHADFGYPKRIAHFVRYMRMVGPDLGTVELNEARLYERWRQFVEECSESSSTRPQ